MTRISSLNALAMCPGFTLLRDRMIDTRPKGAADTGTLVGRMIELWHRGGESDISYAVNRAVAEMPQSCPEADPAPAEAWARAYAEDPRNAGVVEAELQEAEVKLTVERPPEYPGESIVLVGHIDQVRRDPITGGLKVWDVKSGKAGGREMVYEYAWQLACYALACTETWGYDVLPGGIVRVRDYDSPRGNPTVLHQVSWSLAQCQAMVDVAVYRLSELEAGVVGPVPGRACFFCPGGGPDLCPERIDAVLQ